MHLRYVVDTDRTFSVNPTKGDYGASGISVETNNERIIYCDYSCAYEIKNTTLMPKLELQYTTIKINQNCVGLKELPESFIDLRWYENTIDPNTLLEGWDNYKNILPIEDITAYLILRDILLLNLSRFINISPSWDVCLKLSLYVELFKDIPGFLEKLSIPTDLGDQFRGNTEPIRKCLQSGTLKSDMLDRILELMHSLSDELEVAYNIKKLGYDIQFRGKGEPDYLINNVPAEHKSRFPPKYPLDNFDEFYDFYLSKSMNILCQEVKRKGAKKNQRYILII